MVHVAARENARPVRVVGIGRARTLKVDKRPSTDSITTEYDIYCNAPERSKGEIVESEIRADMRNPLKTHEVLGKARYVIENAETAFKEQDQRRDLLLNMITIISEYGEPEGTEVLLVALGRYQEDTHIRKAISAALANIGTTDSLNKIIDLTALSPKDEIDGYFEDIDVFLQRHPECKIEAARLLDLLAEGLRETDLWMSVKIRNFSDPLKT